MTRKDEDDKATEFLQGVSRTLHERAKTYPAYSQEATRGATIWTALHPDRPMSPSEFAEVQLITKLVRHSAGNSPDSLTDLVGYAARIGGMDASA